VLRHLSVQNFAIVDRVDLEFEPGLNVLTGETGAGKSLLVDALYFLLGDRLDPGILRTGEEKATAEALFQLEPSSPAIAKLSDWGLEAPGGEILLKREFNRSSGKTRSFVNGSLATAAMVSELADFLVDLHGQHEHQAIFNVGRHRRLVDASGHLEKPLQSVSEAYRSLSGLLGERTRLGGDAKEAARRQDLLAFQVNELESAGLESLDEESILREYQALKHAGRITDSLREAQDSLDGAAGGGAASLAGQALNRIQDCAKLDPSLEPLVETARQAQETLNQLSYDLSRRLESGGYSEDQFRDLSERVDLIHTLKKKYGESLGEVRGYLGRARFELDDLQNREGRLKAVQADIDQAAEVYRSAASDLHVQRVKAGRKLTGQVKELLEELGLPGARLEVAVEAQEQPDSPVSDKGKRLALSPQGWDKVEFQFSANPGEPLRPLAKVASGGEASRVMLALKAALADSDEVPVLVFDEIDTGVGARTAPAVGRVMEDLAARKQLLCISHLAPLAGLGNCHYQIRKQVSEGKTFTLVKRLQGEERVEELAKMLGGERVSEASLRHARELLKGTPPKGPEFRLQ